MPAQYDPAVPAALMVFQDGQAFKNETGDMRAQFVMDNQRSVIAATSPRPCTR